MFELSIAGKYLIPKKRQLSVSLIALMSVTVISLVVWLLLVFLSVTEGMEKGWLERLTALNSPLRITPTEKYYSSFYYQIDSLAADSSYTSKTIREKLAAKKSNPHSRESDEQIPLNWPKADLNSDGSLKDPVKGAFAALTALQKKQNDLFYQEYEISGALLRLQMLRPDNSSRSRATENFLTQVSYLSSYTENSPYLRPLLMPPTAQDLQQLLFLSSYQTPNSCADTSSPLIPLPITTAKANVEKLRAQLGI